ncbi:unnamed protein product, partial [Prorocentrum cordatum]
MARIRAPLRPAPSWLAGWARGRASASAGTADAAAAVRRRTREKEARDEGCAAPSVLEAHGPDVIPSTPKEVSEERRARREAGAATAPAVEGRRGLPGSSAVLTRRVVESAAHGGASA